MWPFYYIILFVKQPRNRIQFVQNYCTMVIFHFGPNIETKCSYSLAANCFAQLLRPFFLYYWRFALLICIDCRLPFIDTNPVVLEYKINLSIHEITWARLNCEGLHTTYSCFHNNTESRLAQKDPWLCDFERSTNLNVVPLCYMHVFSGKNLSKHQIK